MINSISFLKQFYFYDISFKYLMYFDKNLINFLINSYEYYNAVMCLGRNYQKLTTFIRSRWFKIHGYFYFTFEAVHKRRHHFFKIFYAPPPLSSNVHFWQPSPLKMTYAFGIPLPRNKNFTLYVFSTNFLMSKNLFFGIS